jgi:hypothetical protein
MRPFALSLFAAALPLVAIPCGAWADACREEIAALWDGPMDPFQRPPHMQIVQMLDVDGNETRVFHNTVETPLRTIAGERAAGHFTLAIDRDVWNGPSEQGPWTVNAGQMPEGREATMRAQYAQQQANLTDTVCHGADEAGLIRYTYRTQTDKDATGSFFGSLDTVWLDPEMGQIVRFELSEFVNPWTKGVSKERHLIEVVFDPAIKVVRPE